MSSEKEFHRYYSALKLQWFVIATLVSLTSPIIILFMVSGWLSVEWSIESIVFSSACISAVAISLFWEWYLEPSKVTWWGRRLDSIFQYSFRRVSYLSEQECLRRSKNLAYLLAAIFLSALVCWVYPMAMFVVVLLVSGFSGVFASYQIEEEINAPKGYKQTGIMAITVTVLLVILLIGWAATVNEVQFNASNRRPTVYGVYLSAAFAGGFITTFLFSIPRVIRFRQAKFNKSRKADA